LSVSVGEVRAFRDHLLKTYKTSTARKIIRFLSGLHSLCQDEGYVSDNPYKGCLKRVRDAQTTEKASIPIDTFDTVQSLPDANQTLFWIVAYTGMRITEAMGLRVCDVDLENMRMNITPHEQRRLKNESSRRVVPIDPRLAPYLENKLKTTQSELLFPEHLSASGRWTIPSFWQRRLGFGAHLLRHTVTTQLRQAGVNESVIAALLGHTAPSMTARYGSVPQEALQAAVAYLKWV
jgi:integrase